MLLVICASESFGFYLQKKVYDNAIQIEQLEEARDLMIDEYEKEELSEQIWSLIDEKFELSQKTKVCHIISLLVIIISGFLSMIKPKKTVDTTN